LVAVGRQNHRALFDRHPVHPWDKLANLRRDFLAHLERACRFENRVKRGFFGYRHPGGRREEHGTVREALFIHTLKVDPRDAIGEESAGLNHSAETIFVAPGKHGSTLIRRADDFAVAHHRTQGVARPGEKVSVDSSEGLGSSHGGRHCLAALRRIIWHKDRASRKFGS